MNKQLFDVPIIGLVSSNSATMLASVSAEDTLSFHPYSSLTFSGIDGLPATKAATVALPSGIGIFDLRFSALRDGTTSSENLSQR